MSQILEIRFIFSESCWKGFNSVISWKKKKQILTKKSILGVIFKKKSGSILWVIFKKHSILWIIFLKSSISTLSHVICSILWVILKRKVQFCESCSKQGQSLSAIVEKGFKNEEKVQSFELYRKKRFNSLGHVKQKVQSIESIFEKVQFLESVFL